MSKYLLPAAISLMLVSLGHLFVLQRSSSPVQSSPVQSSPVQSSPVQSKSQLYLSVGGDTEKYVLMVRGKWQEAAAPFRFRVLVPWLSSFLPYDPLTSLRIFTYLGLFGFYFFLMLTCMSLQLSMLCSVAGIAVAYVSIWQLYHFHNPFLVDGVGLLALALLLYAFVTNRLWLFLGVLIVGTLARETTVFLAPLWLLRQIRWGIVATMLAVVVLFLPRLLLGLPSDSMTFSSALWSIGIPRLQMPLQTLKPIVLAWGASWLILFGGLWLFPKLQRTQLLFASACLLAGATLTTLLAHDIGRMFGILAPVVALAAAQLFTRLQHKHPGWTVGWIFLIVVKLHFALPNMVFPKDSWVFHRLVYRGIWGITELVFVVAVLWLVWRETNKPQMNTDKHR